VGGGLNEYQGVPADAFRARISLDVRLNIMVKWRVINPVTCAIGIILLLLMLFWALNLAGSDKTVTFSFVIKSFFYPFDMPTIKSINADRLGNIRLHFLLLSLVWFGSLLISAQPYQPKLRFIGSFVGVLTTLGWSFLCFFSGINCRDATLTMYSKSN
jgi:hypothetical protein